MKIKAKRLDLYEKFTWKKKRLVCVGDTTQPFGFIRGQSWGSLYFMEYHIPKESIVVIKRQRGEG